MKENKVGDTGKKTVKGSRGGYEKSNRKRAEMRVQEENERTSGRLTDPCDLSGS